MMYGARERLAFYNSLEVEHKVRTHPFRLVVWVDVV